MKKVLLFAFMLFTSAVTWAQSDASKYFDGKPYGWGTCTDAAGTAYNLNGGYGYGEAKSVTITASGADDDNQIMDAIAKNDIVIFDGSKGNFIVSTQLKIANAQNKTLVGINNARLCTKFQLTAAIRAHLKAANLDKYSSTKQISGTLPNGDTYESIDERAFYTKKAMIEATGDNNQSYARSGVFQFDATDRNIIVRNITFEGPGSVDVDGVDLISQYGATNVWIDHCTFIDGMDGNLDSGKRKGTPMFVSYTWNKFMYTERSFSHPYSNGTGWMNGENHQYITYANCWWAEGCGRRLPQADDVDIHILNCYYSCSDNSAAIAINNNSNALIEGNYAEPEVKSPIAFANGGTTFYTLKDNHFNSPSTFDKNISNKGTITVPYTYTVIPTADVPAVISGENGAGATLSNEDAMPIVEANEKPSSTLYTWIDNAVTTENDFSVLTYPDGAKLILKKSGKAWSNGTNVTYQDSPYKTIKVSNGAQNEFVAPTDKKVSKVVIISYINVDAPNRTPYWKEVGGVSYTEPVLGSYKDGANPDIVEYTIDNASSFTFTNSGEQLCFILDVTYVSESTGIENVSTNLTRRAAYNLNGQRVNAANTKGILIIDGKKAVIK